MINEDKFLTDIRKLEVRDDLTKEMLLSVLTRSKPGKDKKKTSNAELELQLVNNNNGLNTTTSPLPIKDECKSHYNYFLDVESSHDKSKNASM